MRSTPRPKPDAVEVHRPGKVLVPTTPSPATAPGGGYTKADLAAYHRSLASFMLPHLRGRPLMLERHPDGVGGPRFMQKNVPGSYPEWIRRAELPKEGGTVLHAVCDDPATLVFLVDQGCVTLHRRLSRADRPREPDRMVFDLDPAGDDFGTVRETAQLPGKLLDAVRLPSAVMTTAVRKEARGGRLYLDVQRNGYARTAVAPCTVRALPDAPVAVPITWDQLTDPALTGRGGRHVRRPGDLGPRAASGSCRITIGTSVRVRPPPTSRAAGSPAARRRGPRGRSTTGP